MSNIFCSFFSIIVSSCIFTDFGTVSEVYVFLQKDAHGQNRFCCTGQSNLLNNELTIE